MKTTYQLTADCMLAKYDACDALDRAIRWSRNGRDQFWTYVAECILETAAA